MSLSVAHFTSQLAGGAGIAAYRLHHALRNGGIDSHLFFGEGSSSDPKITPLFQNNTFIKRNQLAIKHKLKRSRESSSGYLTSPDWVAKTPLSKISFQLDVVNLHWVANWLDLPSFFESIPKKTPVVWSIHDMIPITGGCSYSNECNNFTSGCGNCPQLKKPSINDFSSRYFKIKKSLYQETSLHFVGNSEWTTDQLRKSSLSASAASIRTIHLGINPADYSPISKTTARAALRIPEKKFVIGFASVNLEEKRKGGGILHEVLKNLDCQDVVLVSMGGGSIPNELGHIETLSLGATSSKRLQSVFYSALDVFVMPSLVETFGLVALEAMSCETPIISYTAGGLADVVSDGETGLVEQNIGSVEGLAQMLLWMKNHQSERVAMGLAARQRVIIKFSDSLMAKRYAEMYQEILSQ